jgi:pSer/pThr/pTyr-binding forkhead associated (FHA) protein
MWILETSTHPEGRPARFRLRAGHVRTMGRAAGADFTLDAATLSRLHCRLTVTEADQLEVEDLDSTNGTFVNDERVDRAILAAGDRLRLGRVELTVARAAEREGSVGDEPAATSERLA